MKKRVLLIAVFLLIMAASAPAADVTGKWVAQMQGGQGTTEVTFNLKAEGAQLTGTVTDPRGENPISEGKIDGDQISFYVVRSFNDMEIKTLWKGTVSGDQITFTREFSMPPGGFGGPGGPGMGPGGGPGGGPGMGPGAGPGMGPGGGPGGGGPRPPREIIAKRVG